MQPNNVKNHCWIKEEALKQMIHFADNTYTLETGGVLVGYIAENGEPVIMDIIGPGSNAEHFRFSFLPDHKWQCEQLDIHHELSEGKLVYLGDWHTHPNGTPNMSWTDKRTLMRIAKYPTAYLTRPLMLIGAGIPNEWEWKCHQHIDGKFFNFFSQHRNLNIKRFK